MNYSTKIVLTIICFVSILAYLSGEHHRKVVRLNRIIEELPNWGNAAIDKMPDVDKKDLKRAASFVYSKATFFDPGNIFWNVSTGNPKCFVEIRVSENLWANGWPVMQIYEKHSSKMSPRSVLMQKLIINELQNKLPQAYFVFDDHKNRYKRGKF